jgi:hypothetical protein
VSGAPPGQKDGSAGAAGASGAGGADGNEGADGDQGADGNEGADGNGGACSVRNQADSSSRKIGSSIVMSSA